MATLLTAHADLAFSAIGQASKRGIIPRLPAPTLLLDDVERWLRSQHGETVRSIVLHEATEAVASLTVSLHPAAPDLVLTADEFGRVAAGAVTSAVGPGYHTFACRLVRQLGEELGVDWAGPDAPEPSRDPTGFFASADRRDAERGHLGWLGATLARARIGRADGAAALHLGTPPGVRFEVDGALATPMGPRDDAWLERAASDPRVAVDIWPWYTDAMDGRYRLHRALSLMWTAVRWRRPADPVERELADEVLRQLHRAYPLDPALPFPWREWQELAELAGSTDPMAELIAERAARIDPSLPRIGYRRRPVTIVHEGWRLTVPGTYDEIRTAEEWSGGEGGRRVTLAAVRTGTDAGPMPAEVFLRQVAGNLGSSALDHHAGEVVGRARISTDDSSGITTGIVEGYVAVRGSGAAIRVEFDDPADWQWALDQWRALRPE